MISVTEKELKVETVTFADGSSYQVPIKDDRNDK